MKVTWFTVDVTCAPDVSEAIAETLDRLGSVGTAIDSLRRRPGEPVLVTGFFEEPVSLTDVEGALDAEFAIYELDRASITSITFRDVEDADWLAEWKKHWRSTEIGKFIIAPPWAEVAETDKYVIRIEPNMAFGTGTHETTQLCLQKIGEIYKSSMTLLDVGTGTGILAIAAAKLGGTTITACDVDRDSVKIARENALANGVGASIKFFEGPITNDTPAHDLVSANLTLDVILPILPLLLEKTKRFLLLSGILVEQQNDIVRALDGYEPRVETAREWISVFISR